MSEAILVKGDAFKTRIGVVDVLGRYDKSDGVWQAWGFAPGAGHILASASGPMPDDAVSALRHELGTLWGQLGASLWGRCECGAKSSEHDCDPATVRMDSPDMHPLEPEAVQ